MAQSLVSLDMEIRKLRPAELYILGQILNMSDSWKKLMAIIPKEGSDNLPKFNTEHISMIEQAVQQQRRSAAEIFLDEWSTMGRNRPTLRTLLNLLIKAELFRAADYIAGDILKGELPKRPQCGPAAAIDISDETIRKLLEENTTLLEDQFNESLALGSELEFNVSKIVYPPDQTVDDVNPSSLERTMQSTKLVFADKNCEDMYLDESGKSNMVHGEVSRKSISDLIKFSTNTIPSADVQNETFNPLYQSHDASVIDHSQVENVENVHASNHVKIQNILPLACTYKKEEMTSQELPTFLNDFQQKMNCVTINQEMNSDELPIFVNNNISNSSTTSSYSNNNTSTSMERSDLFNLPSFNIKDGEECTGGAKVSDCSALNEMTSTELPQSVIELKSRTCQKSTSHNRSDVEEIPHNMPNALNSQELPITVVEYTNI
ncbi:hypothetical protein KM043_018633 [Ampulex compressa]|nr:hypothetical protein KM043_018633 [Ampulex compressa]